MLDYATNLSIYKLFLARFSSAPRDFQSSVDFPEIMNANKGGEHNRGDSGTPEIRCTTPWKHEQSKP